MTLINKTDQEQDIISAVVQKLNNENKTNEQFAAMFVAIIPRFVAILETVSAKKLELDERNTAIRERETTIRERELALREKQISPRLAFDATKSDTV